MRQFLLRMVHRFFEFLEGRKISWNWLINRYQASSVLFHADRAPLLWGPLRTFLTIIGGRITQWLCMDVTGFGMFKREVTTKMIWCKDPDLHLSLSMTIEDHSQEKDFHFLNGGTYTLSKTQKPEDMDEMNTPRSAPPARKICSQVPPRLLTHITKPGLPSTQPVLATSGLLQKDASKPFFFSFQIKFSLGSLLQLPL